MSNLIRKQIVDRRGRQSVRWVRPDTSSALTGAALPPPSVAVQQQQPQDHLRQVIELFSRYGGEEAAALYDSYFRRLSPEIHRLLVENLTDADTDRYLLVRHILDHAANQVQMRMLLNMTDTLAGVGRGIEASGEPDIARQLSGARDVMDTAWMEHIRRGGNTVPDDFDVEKHLPRFRAAVIVEALSVAKACETTFDVHDQIATVRANADLFTERLPDLMPVTRKLRKMLGEGVTAETLMDLCDVLDRTGISGAEIVPFVEERRRLDPGEIEAAFSTRTLSSGAL